MRGIALLVAALALVGLVVGLWLALDDGGGTTLAAGGLDPVLAADLDRDPRGPSADGEAAADRRDSERHALEGSSSTAASTDGAPAAPEPEGVHGRVVDEAGAPVEGARVLAAAGRRWLATPLDLEPLAVAQPFGGGSTLEATTDAGGRWSFAADALDAGPLRVVVRRAGYAPARIDDWTVPEERPCAMPDVVLRPGLRLEGSVLDEGGEPIAGAALLLVLAGDGPGGARLVVPGRGVPLATTGADGRFVADELEPGPWTAIVEAPGYVPLRAEGVARAGEVGRTTLVLRRGLSVAGRVTGLPAGELARVEVVARRVDAERGEAPPPGFEDTEERRPRRAVPSAEGAFEVAGLLPGARYRLTALRLPEAGADSDPRSARARRLPEEREVVAPAGARGVELALGAPARLVALVVDAASGAPVEELVVFARGAVVEDAEGEPRRHWAGGVLECPDLRVGSDGGDVSLRVRARGYEELEAGPWTLRPGEERDVGELRLRRAPALEVRVTDAATGAPIEGALVVLTTEAGERLEGWVDRLPEERDRDDVLLVPLRRTDAAGRARLDAPAGEAVHVQAGAAGYRASEPEIVVVPATADAAGPARVLDVALRRGGSVVVRVVDPTGRPVEGERIVHRAPGERQARNAFGPGGERTDARGEVRFASLDPGAHAFGFASAAVAAMIRSGEPGGGPAEGWTTVSVVEGGEHAIELVTEERGGLRGRVREGGRPLAEARVRLVSTDRSPRAMYSAAVFGQADPTVATTDAEGRFALEGVATGAWELVVTHADREMSERVPVTVAAPAPEVTVDLSLSIVEGRVTTLEGAPLAGIEVTVAAAGGGPSRDVFLPTSVELREDEEGDVSFSSGRGGSSAVTTDDAGRYALRGVRASTPLVVTASGEGIRSTSTEPFEVAPDEVARDVDLAVPLAGSILVRLAGDATGAWYRVRATLVVDGTEGEPGGGAAPPARPRTRDTYVFGSRREGRIQGLEAGRWRLSIQAYDTRGGGERTIEGPELEVVEGRTTEFELRVP